MKYYLKKFWGVNTAASIFQILTCGMQVVVNLLMMQMFQAIINLDLRLFAFWALADVLLFIAILLFDSIGTYFRATAIRKMNNAVRKDIAASLLAKSHQEYHAQDTGEYLSQLTNDVNQIEQLAWSPFHNFIGYVAQVVFSIIALLSLHWSLALASLITSVIMIAAPKLFQKQMERLGKTCTEEQAAAVSKLKDLLSGYDVLRFFGREQRFSKDSEEASDQIEQPKRRMTCQQTYISNGLGIINVLCQMAVNLLIATLSIQGIIIQSALVGGGNLSSSVSNGVDALMNLRLSFSGSKPYFEKITVHAEDTVTSASKMNPLQNYIDIKHLDFSYEQKPVLQNISLRFEIGKKYALTGPSGCGKSTLLKLLLGWLPDYNGYIYFDDNNARKFSPEQLQQQMSYIEQDVFLFNTTIKENITLGEAFSEKDIQKAIQDSALKSDLLNMPDGIDTIVGEDGKNLSGGQKQRVAIARALIHNRSILLIDEGTSALDKKNADIVEQSLLSNPALTLILVSHHLSEERKTQFDQVYDLQTVSLSTTVS